MFDDRKLIACSRLLAKVIFAGSVFLCSSGNTFAALQITKNIAPATIQPAADNDFIFYTVDVTNTGPGVLSNVVIDDVLGIDLNNLIFQNAPLGGSQTGAAQYTIPNMASGQSATLNIRARVNATRACPIIENEVNVSEGSSTFTDSDAAPDIEYDFEFTSGTASNVISHVTATSFCEFCDTGEVHITITNPTTAPMTNITLVENLQSLGLTFINGSTTSSIGGAANPTITGGGAILTWTPAEIGALASLAAGATIEIAFDVSTYTEASILADPNRNLFATASFDMSCLAATKTVNSGQFELPIRQPLPTTGKNGRNFDAGQLGYAEPIFGSENDDVIWRVDIDNPGLADMEALRIVDAISGNFSINFICPTEFSANATAVANGVGAAGCVLYVAAFDVDDPFGNAADPNDVAQSSTNAFIYFVGRILNTHTNEINNADISYGCEATSPGGGLITMPASVGGGTPGTDLNGNSNLNTIVTPANLQVTQTVTGSNPGQPLGTKGLMTITLNNQSGGSIQNITVDATLPAGYVMDNTYGDLNGVGTGQPTSVITPAYGNNYPGFIDTFTRDDPELVTPDPLDDTNPSFTLTSSAPSVIVDLPQQQDMLRNGDQVSFTFGIVMVEATRFDLAADLDLAPEVTAGASDPTSAVALSNDVDVNFDAVDPLGVQNQTRSETFNYNSDPEDLDIAITDALFILTNDPGVPLDLSVQLTNNGGHDADDYTAYLTFGQAMTVQTVPLGCAGPVANPPPEPHWDDPASIPATANVYACDRGVIGPGATETFTFTVVKTNAPAIDDLTFRADVMGEIHLFNSTPGTPLPLTFPAPVIIPDTTPNIAQLANNYSFDAIRSRVLGFNLIKNVWYCAEDGLAEPAVPANVLSPAAAPPNTPALTGNLNSQIGEDCNYRVESGGWFGFVTPGFALIEVRDVTVTDDLPDGQGFIAFGGSAYNYTSTPGITLTGVDGGAGSTPLNETDISWSFNAAGSGIGVADEFFRVDFKTRLLNDPVDLAYPVVGPNLPNLHGNISTDVATTSFTAVFQSDPIAGVPQPPINIDVSDTVNSPPGYIVPPGYPAEAVRTVDLTEVEPNLIVTKQVCNETLSIDAGNGSGENCSPFLNTVNNGDTNDLYVYRVTLTNETAVPVRTPAYNVIATDTLDSSDLMLIADFGSDGLDNDGDGLIDVADPLGEGSISENVANGLLPAVITVSHTHSNALLQIDPGAANSVVFYYRVDPDDAIAPLQLLTNTVGTTYDSLEGATGNQNDPKVTNTNVGTAGSARVYSSIDATADVRMIPLVAQPKAVIALANTPLALGAPPHNVVVGEEIQYELTAQLPVANLRSFKIRDELPEGLTCIEAPSISLESPDYIAAGFNPGTTISGPIVPTCNDSVVEWNFGDQELTMSPGITRFDFIINFIARVENTSFTNDGVTITNGGGAGVDPVTCSGGVAVCYVNETPSAVALNFAPVSVTVTEPTIVLTKSFAVANSDAADILTVTVTAENTGSAPAYNLQLLDDLLLTDMTYINDSMLGADAPDDDGVAADSKSPTFSWLPANPDYEILPGVTKTFTFQVQVDTSAQPLEILDNTIQARWDSLPGQTSVLNSAGRLDSIGIAGADGGILGLRNGAVPNIGAPANAPNDYETTASDSTSVLPLTMTKTDLTPAVIATIGAHKNFQIEISLPEGTTNNVVVTDNLIFSGLSYALSHNATYDVTYEFFDIDTINTAVSDEAAFTSFPAVDATGSVVWNIGTVVTLTEDDSAVNVRNPIIRINYFARVNNDTLTDVGGTLQNTATLNYQNGEVPATTEAILDNTPVETVVEPNLTVTRTVTNQTVGKLTTDLPDAGDILEYAITINNGGNATAFDVNLVETLSAELLFDNTFTVTAIIGVTPVALFVDTPTGALPGTGPLTWGRDNADNTLDIPATESIVLTYRAVVQNTTEPNTLISNSVLVDWTSLDNADLSSPFERTGGTCPVIVTPDDYCIADTSIDINTIDANSIVKSVILDTYDTGLSTAVDSTVRIGDTVTYQIDIAIQEGTTESVNIQDVLPGGMAFVDVVSINNDLSADYDPPGSGSGSNFTYGTLTAGDFPAVNATGTVNWNFGTIVNDAAGDATTDTIVIVYRARVVDNDVITTTIAHQPTTTLTNMVDLTYIDGLGAASPSVPRLTDTADVIVLQPVMDALTKVDRDGDPIHNNPVNVATDIINFRLESCNTTGLAPAYGLLVTDTLAMQYDEGSITVPVVTIGGVLATEGAANDYVYTPPAVRGGDMVFTFATPVDPGECVNIDFDIGFYTDFGFGTWDNSVTVNEYYSLPPADAQLYGPLVPAIFTLSNPATAFDPPVKVKTSADDAVVGDEVVYTITVPGAASGASIYDVTVSDNLDASLVFVSATDISVNAFTLINDTVVPNQLRLVVDNIPAGQQAIIEVRARVDNNDSADSTVSFNNSSSYTYAASPAGATINVPGSGVTAIPLNIVEPELTSLVTATNLTNPGILPVAGDIVEITTTLNANGGILSDNFSDAFDVSYDETLSLGLAYINATATITGIASPPLAPVITGDGISAVQNLRWSLEDANADIDIPEGNIIPVVITYQVRVLDTVQSNQPLTNNVRIEWTSRDDAGVVQDVNERNGSEAPAVNDYFINDAVAAGPTTTSNDTNIIAKSRLLDTFAGAIPNTVRIGDIVEYELRLTIQPGTHPDVVVADTLPQGLAFEEIVSINGDTSPDYTSPGAGAGSNFVYSTIAPADIVVAGNPALAASTVSWNIGTLVNQGLGDSTTDDLVIVYRARVLNLVYPQTPTTFALTNNVNFNFDTFTGAEVQPSSETISLMQPDITITKTAVPAGGITPADTLNTIIDANEFIDYTIDIFNGGDSIAYDVVLQDVIPVGLRNGAAAITVLSTQLLLAGTTPANLPPVYDPVTGIATWDFDNGGANTYNIPAGDTLRMVYRIQADAALGAGLTMTNTAQVLRYYSFDDEDVPVLGGITGVREIYLPSNISQVTFTTTPANALLKTNPVDLYASIGETFTYSIFVPDVIQATALHDVQILDDLDLSAADLLFVSITKVSAGGTWVPTNIGTPTSLIIADTTNGIDIPANEQIEIAVTVTLRNTPPAPPVNVSGLLFDNAASYTFNGVNDEVATVSVGAGNTTPTMTVVEPDLTLVKTGPVGNVNFTAPIPYTLVVENVGDGPAFDTTIIDKLPAVPDNPPLTGGTCNATPINIVVNIFENDGTTEAVRPAPLPLVLDTDYNVTYTAAPTCELVITTVSDKARIEATEKLIVTYETTLDVATQSSAELTNIAGVTQWFSLDTAGAGATDEIREYTSALTSSATVTVEAPVLDFQKTVTLQNDVNGDGIVNPGDTLRYSIFIENTGPIALPDFSLTDDVDGLAPASGFFASGTMTNIVIPASADGSNTNIAGGTNGAGLLDVRNLSIDEAGGANPTVLIEFDITLLPVIDSNTIVLNQAQIDSPSTGVLLSDYPITPGMAEPTQTLITSAPVFLVQKTSLDITGDPAILMPGDTLRYTLTVKNIGLENAINTMLSDQVPANTSYVANSTRLNAVVVSDPVAGISPLAAGMFINAPEDTTAGFLRADTNPAAENVATITFDVVINLTTVNGTMISNQGFFNGAGVGSGVFPQQPSDDPDTALVDDPTIDVVGNVPVVDSLKTVALQVDVNSNGHVDPGDTLRYTITTINIGALPATNVVLSDNMDLPVAGQMTYVAGSGLLDGLPAGVSFAGSLLTATIGELLPANSAVVTFDVVVNAGIAAGTIISNQGFVASNELPTEPTDADGNDANGDQPTIIVVGNVQQLSITKQVIVIGGGAAEVGKELEYVVRVTNIGSIAAQNVVITSDLDLPVLGQVTYVAGSGLLDGLVTGVSLVGSTVTVNYGDLPAAAVTELRFRVLLGASLIIGDTIVKTTDATWNSPSTTVSATVSVDIGGTPGSVNINGLVWHDTDFNNVTSASEVLLQDYRVELYRNNALLANTLTDVNGVFQFTGLPPVLPTDDLYELRYLAPGATATTATLGTTNSAFSNGAQRITGIFAASGSIVQGLNLPRQVNGIVYDSVLRVPVAGVQLTMINQSKSNQPVPANCFADAIHANQVTQADGYYKFDLNFSDSSRCAQNDEYVIQVQPPASGYIGTTSVIIPPLEPITGNALDVPNCPGNLPADKIPATAEHCENSVSDVPAPVSVEPRAAETDYNLKFLFDGLAVPQLPPPAPLIQETNQIFNNHIPVDSELGAVVAISKVAGKLNVTRSDLVTYTITFNNTLGVPLFDVSIIDNFPAGFKYITGSARVDGVEIEPQINGQFLTWPGLSVDINQSRVIKLLLVVGSGVGEGEYVNTARAINTLTGDDISGVASATVRVIPDPTFDCTDIIGKVFDDKNLNAYQDKGETGIPGVQVSTARGLRVTTDAHGRFHITCAIVANEVRGSNFIMKLDDRTLPSGYRVTTENPRVQRATRGKMLKFNFGTAIHRVVRLDLADGVFEKGSTVLRPQWESRIELLITELQKEGSILRLSYLGENESEDEVENRLDAIEELVSDRWQELDCCYKLTIETEVFWRKGKPSDRKEFE